ncbi:hypothetical protein TWF506_000236 [Arthrobotrys conoides]|uniref:Uncharacterized protein n=1 Tax=Arthrobotrys conoides TaxID=74498 RepID=A0AAN8PQJ1_9PEZI
MKFKRALKRLKHFCCCCCASSASSGGKEEAPRIVQNPNLDGAVDIRLGNGRSGDDDGNGGSGIISENANINTTSNSNSDNHPQLIPEFDFELPNSLSEFSLELGPINLIPAQEAHNQEQTDLGLTVNIEIEPGASSYSQSLKLSTFNSDTSYGEGSFTNSYGNNFSTPQLSADHSIYNSQCTCDSKNCIDALQLILERLEQIERTQRDLASKFCGLGSNPDLMYEASAAAKCETSFRAHTETSNLAYYTADEKISRRNSAFSITDVNFTNLSQRTTVICESLDTLSLIRTDDSHIDAFDTDVPSQCDLKHMIAAPLVSTSSNFRKSRSFQKTPCKGGPFQGMEKARTSKKVNHNIHPRPKPMWTNSKDPNLRRQRLRDTPRSKLGDAPKSFSRTCCTPRKGA